PHLGALVLLGQLQVVDPAPPVARPLPARVDHRAGSRGIALESLRDRVHRQREPVLREDAVHAPEARAAAELEHRLGVQVPAADRRRRADYFVQERLRGGVALERRALPALLVVEDAAQRETRATRPVRIRQTLAIPDE